MMEALRAFWTDRTERERIAAALAVALAVFIIAYAYVWLPVTRERDRLLVRVPELRGEAQAMDRDAQELAKLKVPAMPSISLKASIEQAGSASGLADAAPEVVAQGSAKVRAVIASARAEQALRWLARLQSLPGVRIESIRLTALGAGDWVKVEAIAVAAR